MLVWVALAGSLLAQGGSVEASGSVKAGGSFRLGGGASGQVQGSASGLVSTARASGEPAAVPPPTAPGTPSQAPIRAEPTHLAEEPLPLPNMRVVSAKYGGLKPGPEAKNPLPLPQPDPPQLVWTGFRMAGDKSEIFLQTTRPVEHTVQAGVGKAKRLSVLLKNCRIFLRNNQRNLDTRYFATPVHGVSARQRHKDVELSIVLKETAAADARVEPGPDGSSLVVLAFPPGRPSEAPTARPAEGRPGFGEDADAARAAEPASSAPPAKR
jgi:hypothetical protein